MAIILPFKGIRYNQEKIGNLSLVATPPYDVISSREQEQFYNLHENNIIRIELGKDFEGDNENNNKYTRAGAYLTKWIEDNILVHEKLPSLYIYDQEFLFAEGKTKNRRGLIALVKLAEFSEGIVLPHEYTLSKAKADRFNLMYTTNSNISQIFSLYNDDGNITSILNDFASDNKPEIDYINNQNIREKVWVINDTSIISGICSMFKNKQLFIADGHHRYETALKFRKKLSDENPAHNGNELYNYVMMTLVDMDDPGLVVFPTHRAIRNIGCFDSKKFLKSANKYFDVSSTIANTGKGQNISEQIINSLEKADRSKPSFGYYDGSDYYLLLLKDNSAVEKALPDRAPAYRSLDVAILHALILEEFFEIGEQNMAKETNLSYTRDINEAMEWVRSGQYQCAFFVNPTRVDQIKEVSLANEKMPQKSTYFFPKLTTGLVMNKLR